MNRVTLLTGKYYQILVLFYFAVLNVKFTLHYLVTWVFTNCIWTLNVYLIHRFVFHNLHKNAHTVHHIRLFNDRFYHIPINIIITGFLSLYILSTIFKLNKSVVPCFACHYVIFEICHVFSHIYWKNKHNVKLVNFHKNHHKKYNVNFGFGTPAWDIILGTFDGDDNIQILPFGYIPIQLISFW